MNISLIKELTSKLWTDYEYASILATDSSGKSYNVSAGGIKAAENALYCECGYVIKAYNGKSYCEYSFNELDGQTVSEIPGIIAGLFAAKEKLGALIEGCSVNEYGRIGGGRTSDGCGEKDCLQEQGTVAVSDGEIVDRLQSLRESALRYDDRILDCSANAHYQQYYKYFISPDKELSQSVMWSSGSVTVMAKKGDSVKTSYRACSGVGSMAALDSLTELTRKAADATLELLESGQINPGEYDCVCAPDVTGMIVHEAFGHGVEMDMFVKDRALAREYIGQYVASPLVTMHDGAAAAIEVASYAFDDEGMDATDTVIIDKGILRGGICNAQTAMALDCAYTGNGRRESFERKAYTRMTNTFFEPGMDKVGDMISSIEYGFLLEEATCGMEDPKNWGIQCMVNIAREIKDGKLTGRVFSPVVLSGYVPDLLKSISMMSDRTVLCGSGFCGKGYKEWVKVSDGGPYIKARVQLG